MRRISGAVELPGICMERSAAFHSLLLAAAPVVAESSWTSWNLNPIESVPGPAPGFLRVLCDLGPITVS